MTGAYIGVFVLPTSNSFCVNLASLNICFKCSEGILF